MISVNSNDSQLIPLVWLIMSIAENQVLKLCTVVLCSICFFTFDRVCLTKVDVFVFSAYLFRIAISLWWSGDFNQHEIAGCLKLLSLDFVWSLVSYSKPLYLLLDAICSEHIFLSIHLKVTSGFDSEVHFLEESNR